MHDGELRPLERNHTQYAKDFDELPFERILEKYRFRRSLEMLSKIPSKQIRKVLEIGPGYSPLSAEVFPKSKTILLEPAENLRHYIEEKFSDSSSITIIGQDLGSFFTSTKSDCFDLVILSSVLHELIDPDIELSRIHALLSKNGYFFVVVPNNESVHRLLGVHLGVLESSTSLTSTERVMQQHANYSIESIQKKLKEHNFSIEFITTSFLKPHTHFQMQKWVDNGSLSEEKLENLYQLSEFFSPFNSEIFLLAKKSPNGN